MRIMSFYVRHFRSIENAELQRCGGLNVLIGKNNAGKSNLLSAIEHVLNHLRRGAVAAPWAVKRPSEEFTDREQGVPIQFGIQFDLPADVNEKLRAALTPSAPHLAKSIEQIRNFSSISFIVAALRGREWPFIYVPQIAVGNVVTTPTEITTDGIRLLSTSDAAASELNEIFRATEDHRRDLSAIQGLVSDRRRLDRKFQRPKDAPAGLFYELTLGGVAPRTETAKRVEAIYGGAETSEQFLAEVAPVIAEIKARAEKEANREITAPLDTFAGAAKTPPEYAAWLMQLFGSVSMLHFEEEKQKIGRGEAESLLQLKIKRGGPERMNAVQTIVRGLLGVHIDAFRDDERSPAEMDVDRFLVDANGAGIREALRIVLDLELKCPKLVLIEEPEVHLHPGLARVVANYLREKSSEVQMFVTTHSTEFVDSVSFQNAYLVSKDGAGKTTCQLVEAEEEALRIPAELGLRLSTVFMFDRLLFVEGPSDENVLRLLAQKLDVDLTKCNLGFVQMGGVKNFANFAADATLDLLSRRQVLMWFVVDRDEMNDEDVKRMIDRLGPRAVLSVLDRRELENYLLDADAITAFVLEKLTAAKKPTDGVTRQAVAAALDQAVAELKPEVVRLRIQKLVLTPIYLQSRQRTGTLEERLKSATDELVKRMESLGQQRSDTEESVNQCWERERNDLVPGTLVLEKVAASFGVKFSKEKGDSEKLAALMPATGISSQITTLLEHIAAA
jgi:putative ATP-dependent endonuclease of OLD family